MKALLISKNPILKTTFMGLSLSHPSQITPFYADNTRDGTKLWLEHRPILTVFDIELPNQDPLSFIQTLSETQDLIHSSYYFLFLSNLDPDHIKQTKHALSQVRMGNFLLKELRKDQSSPEEMKEFRSTLEHLFETLSKKSSPSTPISSKSPDIPDTTLGNTDIIFKKIQASPVQVVAIGISTGGPFVLKKLFSELKGISHPIVIVQHMPAGFIQSFVDSLLKFFDFPIQIATQGEILKNKIYFAPDHVHLRIEKIDENLTFLLDHSGPIKDFLPSIEATFESLVMEGIPCLGILMTGLGNDGVDNLTILHEKGNPVIAQSPEDCVAAGMPLSLIKNNGADSTLTIPLIAKILNEME